MNYGQEENPRLITFMCGAVQLRLRYTKFIETRHAAFLEDQMIMGSMVVRKIDLEELIAMDEGEQQQPPVQEMPVAVAPSRPQRIRRPIIPDNYEVYNSEEIQMEDDPTSFEETMGSVNSSKWTTAMEDEIKSMSANKVWDL